MDENIHNPQEVGNLPDEELMDIDDIDCLPLLIMSYYVNCQFPLLIE